MLLQSDSYYYDYNFCTVSFFWDHPLFWGTSHTIREMWCFLCWNCQVLSIRPSWCGPPANTKRFILCILQLAPHGSSSQWSGTLILGTAFTYHVMVLHRNIFGVGSSADWKISGPWEINHWKGSRLLWRVRPGSLFFPQTRPIVIILYTCFLNVCHMNFNM